jgi:hypothetical protein
VRGKSGLRPPGHARGGKEKKAAKGVVGLGTPLFILLFSARRAGRAARAPRAHKALFFQPQPPWASPACGPCWSRSAAASTWRPCPTSCWPLVRGGGRGEREKTEHWRRVASATLGPYPRTLATASPRPPPRRPASQRARRVGLHARVSARPAGPRFHARFRKAHTHCLTLALTPPSPPENQQTRPSGCTSLSRPCGTSGASPCPTPTSSAFSAASASECFSFSFFASRSAQPRWPRRATRPPRALPPKPPSHFHCAATRATRVGTTVNTSCAPSWARGALLCASK